MKNKLALTTIIGLVGGISCVAIAISESGDFSLFINIPSLLIIVGGTACAVVMSYPADCLKALGTVIKQSFINDHHDVMEDIDTIIELSELARREGLLAIESYIEDCDDRFLKKGLSMLVDGTSREDLEASMMSEIYHAQRRHRTNASMISMIATLAPALGLVGTYVGLIPMLVNMRDPDKLGPLMAVELVSSFYGGFLAYVVFSPMAKKLINKSAKEKSRNELLLEGILGIVDGKNPRLIREDLLAYLTYKETLKIPPVKHRTVSEDYSDGKVIEYKKNKASRGGA